MKNESGNLLHGAWGQMHAPPQRQAGRIADRLQETEDVDALYAPLLQRLLNRRSEAGRDAPAG